MSDTLDAIVIGAGAAGLAAARQLHDAGQRVAVLEARDRIGGRIFTLHRPDHVLPIELGAEFVHGRPRETWNILRAARLATYDVPDEHWHLRDEKLKQIDDFWERIGKVNEGLAKLSKRTDVSFDQYLEAKRSRSRDTEAMTLARQYIEGFNAADAGKISAAAVHQAEKDGEKIDATLLFRVAEGYDGVTRWLNSGFDIRLNTIVHAINWRRGKVTVATRSPLGDELPPIAARCAIITLPLGVLQMKAESLGGVRFEPEISRHRRAIDKLAMGPVIKVVCRFRSAFWENAVIPSMGDKSGRLTNAGFFHGENVPLQTWWTMLAMRAPILTGWSGGPAAERLSGRSNQELTAAAVESLTRLLGLPKRKILVELESCHAHDWQSDPFARGAYSYVPVGGLDAMKQLATPVDGTLFFAGEATHWEGMSGTVAGAIASGHRAAASVS